jgi:two-component system, NtrC family, sensor histidine kinase HydH
MKKILLLGGILISAVLTWFTVSNYLSARPIAEENLHGLALSLTSAIENIALHDPSLQSLETFQSHDIAFFALVDRKGLYRFHTNTDLMGTPVQGALPSKEVLEGTTSEVRVTLRTGESAFEFNAPLYLPKEMLALQLTLHTYRADTVIRRARFTMMVLFGLLAAGWVLALVLYRFTRREEQHQLEMTRRESLAHLGEMGAMLAHEIRNPLAGIKGFAQIIEKKPQDARNGDFAQRIVSEVLRLETLVNELLSYAKSDRESMATVHLADVVSHVTALIRAEAEQHQVKIISECRENLQCIGNQDRLTQVLLNVVNNAVQAMPGGGTVLITAYTDSKNVMLIVNDTGQGIGEQDLSRVFEPFFTTRARGTGLGLALCKKIVEEHGGEIRMQSVVGEGTSVAISIPITPRRNNKSRSLS